MPSAVAASAAPATTSSAAIQSAIETLLSANRESVSRDKFASALQNVNLALEGRSPSDVAAFQTQYGVSPATFLAFLPTPEQSISAADDETDVVVRTLTRILEKLLEPMPFTRIADSQHGFGMVIHQGLVHPNHHVQDLALFALEKAEPEELVASQFFLPLVECLSSRSTAVGLRVSALLCKTAHTDAGLDALFSADVVSVLTAQVDESQTNRFRVYDLAISVSNISPRHLRAVQDSSLLATLLADLEDRADVLRRLNVVQVFQTLAGTEAGFQFLEQTEILARLVAIMTAEAVDEIDDVLVVSAVIKFFSYVAGNTPSTFLAACTRHGILDALATQLESERGDLRESVVIALSSIGATSSGLTVLAAHPTLLPAFLTLARGASGDLKLRTLETASCLIAAGSAAGSAVSALSDISRSIYEATAGRGVLLRYARGAYLEPKIAALAVMRAEAGHAWGAREIAADGELVSWLVDRRAEMDTMVVEGKFVVVRELAARPDAAEVLGEGTLARFARYVREGPHWREAAPMVAFQSS
ncbi:26S proteasome non-ATPase regulatory subunit 5 [Geranomyces variabilis]|nr:26S proteasome non-ATPase regulatory subunit 5 [Geranomyces variabilis]